MYVFVFVVFMFEKDFKIINNESGQKRIDLLRVAATASSKLRVQGNLPILGSKN